MAMLLELFTTFMKMQNLVLENQTNFPTFLVAMLESVKVKTFPPYFLLSILMILNTQLVENIRAFHLLVVKSIEY